MKILVFLISFILMSSSIHAQIKTNHIAVHVSNLDKSSQFYEEILDLQEIDEPFKDGLHAWYNIGGGSALHLIEAPDVPGEISKTNHLCFSMQNMDDFISRLETTGYPFEDWPGEKGKITTRPDGVRQIYIQDPDGYWLEINDDF